MSQKALEQPLIPAEKPSEAPPAPEKTVSFLQMFRFADTTDMVLMVIGTLSAVAAGTVMPIFSYIFGDVGIIYADNTTAIQKSLQMAVKFWILAAAAVVLNFGSFYCWSMAGERQSLRYRKIYYKLLLRQQVYWYDITNPNQLATKVTADITAIQGALGQKIATMFMVSVMSVLGFFLAYFRNWRLSLVISATLPALMIAGGLLMKAMQKMGEKNSKTYQKAGATAEQALGAIRTIKAMVGEDYEIKKYVDHLQVAQKQAWKYTLSVASSLGFMILVFLSCYGLGFWYGKEIILSYNYDVTDVISTFFCIIMGGGSIAQLSPALKNIALGKVAIAKIFDLIQRQPTLKQPTNGTIIERINSIQFQQVGFAYPKTPDQTVLKNLNLVLPPGKVTAIVGASGSGKTTIIQLVQRFYDSTNGKVLINGLPITELDLQNFRKKIGYVGQQPAMFAMSIKENMLFAKQDATDQQIEEALKQANAYEFVRKMEKGIDTYLGSGGAQISGGQKQRIAIARAILKNPSLFIFDQATSALDRKNQKLIQQTLHSLSKNRTTLVIAHRLSTIQNADNIIVLDKGELVEQGTHQQLIALQSRYYNLIKNQLQGEQKESQQQIQADLPQLKKDQSIGKVAQAKQQQNKSEKEKKQAAVFSKLIAQSSDNRASYIFGSLMAIINGITFPAFSYFLSNITGIMWCLNKPQFCDQDQTIHKINIYCIGFVVAAAVGGITTFGFHFLFGKLGDSLVYKLRTKAYNKLIRMKVQYFDKPQNNPGAISAKLAQDAYLIHNMTTGVISVIILNIATMGAGLTLAFIYNWRLSLIVIGLSPFLAIAGSLNMKRMKKFSEQTDQAYKQAGNQISDTVCNIRTVKSFGNMVGLIRSYNSKLEVPYGLALKKAFTSGFFQGLGQGIVLLIYGLVFYLAAVLKVKVYDSKPEDIFISIFAIVFAAVGLGNNSSLMPDMAKAKNAGANIYDIIESQDEYQAALSGGGVSKQPIQGNIEFRNVSFKYPSREKIVYKNLNLTINAGNKIGLAGSSGCGKSTILQLILRFYDVTDGMILIDGKNIRDYDLYSLRSNFGVVTQQPVLFSGSIEDNIRYKNTQATFEQVKQAATIAYAAPFIDEAPQGYKKQVGTKGVQISGGQKQRIAIARCLLSNPNIYFFDEATSALDVTTQGILFQNLKKVTDGKTTISIAHRHTTIADSTKIFVFDEGKIVEEGDYEQLKQLKGYFYRLCKL